MFSNPFDLHDKLTSENKPAPDPFGRLGVDEEPDTEIADIKNPMRIKASVGDSGQNSRRDVAKTEQLLGDAGTLDLKKTDGPTGYWGMRTSDATKAFQKQNGLKVDGGINPTGETIRALGNIMPGKQESTETISIGVWPDGKGSLVKPGKVDRRPGENFEDSATDDETSNDDNPKFSRDWRDEALQHLIGSGLDADAAKQFLEMLPDHINEDQNDFVDTLTWLSGKLVPKETSRNIPFPSAGGTRK